MRKSLRSPAHEAMLALLHRARKEAGLTQAELAERLLKPQSFVAKVEGGERRLDVIEFIQVLHAIGADPADAVREIVHGMGSKPKVVRRPPS